LQRFKNGLGHQHFSPQRFYCLLTGSRNAQSRNAASIGGPPACLLKAMLEAKNENRNYFC
jgi:hypothetical protein